MRVQNDAMATKKFAKEVVVIFACAIVASKSLDLEFWVLGADVY